MPRAIVSLGHRARAATAPFLVVSILAHGPALADNMGGRGGFDPVSFSMGAVVSFCAVWILRLPWGRLGERFAEAFRSWRRNAALVMFAAALFGVLLLY
jgi:hypothetical protein